MKSGLFLVGFQFIRRKSCTLSTRKLIMLKIATSRGASWSSGPGAYHIGPWAGRSRAKVPGPQNSGPPHVTFTISSVCLRISFQLSIHILGMYWEVLYQCPSHNITIGFILIICKCPLAYRCCRAKTS